MPSRRGSVVGAVLRAIAILAIAGVIAAGDSYLRPVKTEIGTGDKATPDQPGPTPVKPPVTPVTPPPDTVVPKTTPDSPSGTQTQQTAPDPTTQPAVPVPADLPSGAHISVAQAKALFDNATPFFDARTDAEFAAGHVQTALHITAEDVQAGKADLQYYDASQPIVIYCTGGSCHASENLAILLTNFSGFKKVYIMEAGFDAWKDAGYPVEQ